MGRQVALIRPLYDNLFKVISSSNHQFLQGERGEIFKKIFTSEGNYLFIDFRHSEYNVINLYLMLCLSCVKESTC